MEINFEKILNTLELPIAIFDENDRIIYSNAQFQKVFAQMEQNLTLEELKNHFPQYTFGLKQSENLKILTIKENQGSLDEAYSEFVSTVSHELRTPLTSIRGFADTMQNSYDRLEKAQIVKFLGIIKDQSNRLIKLVENLLSISKMQAQKENFIYKSIQIKDQIAQILPILQKQYPSHKFLLKTSGFIPPILADENKFQQILINLLDNAAKYSPPDSNVKIQITDCDNMVSIKIKDEGSGIAEKDFDKIFEKFVRIENHLTQKAQGSGLGLYIVKNLIEKMGGKISLISSQTPPTGTEFTITLPVANYTAQSGKKLKENR